MKLQISKQTLWQIHQTWIVPPSTTTASAINFISYIWCWPFLTRIFLNIELSVCTHGLHARSSVLSMEFTSDASRIKKQDLNLSHKPSHNSQHCFQFCFVWVISVLDTLVCKNMQKWVCTSSKQYDQFKRDFNVEQAKRFIQNQRFREKSLNDLTILMNHRWLGLWLNRS